MSAVQCLSPTQFLKHVLDDVTKGDFSTIFFVDARLKVAPLQRFKSPATGIGREKI